MLQRYLFREIAQPLLLWLSFLVCLMWMMAVLKGADVLFGSQVTPWDFVRVSVFLLPHFIAQAAPVAFLLALLIGLGRLSQDRELLALQALGVRPRALWVAPLIIAAMVGALLAVLAFGAQPRGLVAAQRLAQEIVKRNLVGDVKGGVFHDQVAGVTLYAGRVDEPGHWSDVFVYDDRQASSMLLLARHGTLQPGSGQALSLDLEGGQLYRGAGAEDAQLAFERGTLTLGVEDAMFQRSRFRAVRDELSPAEMFEAARIARDAGGEHVPLEVAAHWKLGQVLMPVSLAFLGVPLGLRRRTSGRARGVTLTLLGYAIFFLLARTTVSLGEKGLLHPLLAGQLPNLIFVAAGLLAMMWMEKR
jgi:lipopolysaccharide export system permease protein